MQTNEHLPGTLDEAVAEIASILAQGYMRSRRGRQLPPGSGSRVDDVAQVKESEAFAGKHLDDSEPGPSFIHELTPRDAVRTDRPPGQRP